MYAYAAWITQINLPRSSTFKIKRLLNVNEPTTKITRRSFLATACATFYADAGSTRQPYASRSPVGAIRWDAWYAPRSFVTTAVEKTLGASQFAWRRPKFAEECARGPSCFPPASQIAIDQEIEMAVSARLDFWAFVSYETGSPMRKAFSLYMSSSKRHLINFALICECERFGGNGHLSKLSIEHSQLILSDNYQKTPSGKSIYFIIINSVESLIRHWGTLAKFKNALSQFKEIVKSDSNANIELVALVPPPHQGSWIVSLGFTSVGSYSIACTKRKSRFSDLASCVEESWERSATAGYVVVPTVMTGWDRRPRHVNPVPWERRNSNKHPQVSFDQPTLPELAKHIKNARRFSLKKLSPAILVYAWNEFDEGGWMMPTVGDHGEKLKAVSKMYED